MPRKYFLTAALSVAAMIVLFLLGQNLLVGTPHRPMTEEQADALVRREVPSKASVREVKTWLDARHIEHSGYGPHHAGGADGVIGGIIRDTGRPGVFISADIQLNFTFNKQHRLMAYSSSEVLTGP